MEMPGKHSSVGNALPCAQSAWIIISFCTCERISEIARTSGNESFVDSLALGRMGRIKGL